MLKVKFILAFLFMTQFTPAPNAQSRDMYQKAEYIVKISEFVEWPAEHGLTDTPDQFVIGVIGNPQLAKAFKDYTSNLKIQRKIITIKVFSKPAEIKNINCLFISEAHERNIEKIMMTVRHKPVLTFTDDREFKSKGIHVFMYLTGKDVHFNIDNEALRLSGLKVSFLLLKLVQGGESM